MKKGKYRKSLFIVIYSRVQNKIEYLVLKRKLHWTGWEFPKGGKKFFETDKMTIKREIKEEASNLKILNIKKFNEGGKFKYKKELPDRKGIIGQTYKLYAVEVKKGKIDLKKNCDEEHSDYKWASFNEALRKLTWINQKKCLRIVNNWLGGFAF